MKPIKFKFDERKAVQAAGRLISRAGGEMNYLALLKLLYLIDREALLRWGKSITGDKIVAMKRGPVLSRIFDLVSQKKQNLPKSAWHNLIPRPAPYVYTVRFGGLLDISALSEAEVALIDEVFAQHRNKTEDQLVELTHKLPEWSDPGKTSVPIPFEKILRAAKIPQSEIAAIASEAAADWFMDEALASVRRRHLPRATSAKHSRRDLAAA
jgi:uncharacterized phage-associated protein